MPFFSILAKLALENALGLLVQKVVKSVWKKIKKPNKAKGESDE